MKRDESGPSGREQLLDALIEHFAEHGVNNQSLRTLATAVGTSHRMLIYHFGSRDGLLTAVVSVLERQQREVLASLAEPADAAPREVALRFWSLVVGPALRYGPLFFELSAHVMQGRPQLPGLRESLVESWLGPLTTLMTRAGHDRATARVHARLGLAVARGLLHDVLITRDLPAADAAMTLFVDLVAAATPDPTGTGVAPTGATPANLP